MTASRAALPYWQLSGYYFFYFAFIGGFSPYFGLYLQARGFSPWEIALLLSQMQLMRIIAPNLWGWLADRFHCRVGIVRLAAAFSVAGFAAIFLVDSFAGWLAAMAVLAFFWGAALPLVESLTLDHLGAESARYSRIRLWGSIGFIVSVTAIGALLDQWPLSSLLPMLLALLVGIMLCSFSLGEAPHVEPPDSTRKLVDVLRERPVQALLASCFAMSAAHGALYVFYSIWLAEHGYSRSLVGALWSLGVVAEIVVFLFMARLMRRFALRAILLACFIAATVRFLMIGWGVGSLAVLILAQLLHALTFGAYHAAAIAAVNAWFPPGTQGRGQALYSSVSFGAGGMVGGVLAGALWEAHGGALTYTVSAACALLGALAVAAVGDRQAHAATGR